MSEEKSKVAKQQTHSARPGPEGKAATLVVHYNSSKDTMLQKLYSADHSRTCW